jgi:hypothetical protein
VLKIAKGTVTTLLRERATVQREGGTAKRVRAGDPGARAAIGSVDPQKAKSYT